MNLIRFEKIEALLSVIEEQELLIYENSALMAYYDQLEKNKEHFFQDFEKERLFYFFKQNTIRWKSWLMISLNVHTHNLRFYENRLNKLLLEE